MTAPLDLDQLQTFIAIADTGSFTRAADDVHRTQSAVSMQMRRLEERIGKPLFEKDGRNNRLTEEGERLLAYARRMLHLNRETLAAFDDTRAVRAASASARPTTMPTASCRRSWRASRAPIRASRCTVICEPTPELVRQARAGNLDLAIVTTRGDGQSKWCGTSRFSGSARPSTGGGRGGPAAGAVEADLHWRDAAIGVLAEMGRKYRVLYQSANATAITAAVLPGWR